MPAKRQQFRLRKPAKRMVFQPPQKARTTPQYERACRIRSSTQWQSVRTAQLANVPVCEWCNERPADQVHHVEAVATAPELALDPENLWSVCTRCHELIESAGRRGVDLLTIKRGLTNGR